MKKKIIELFGWYGTVVIVGTYALVSFSLMQPTSLIYQLLNLSAAVGILTLSFYKKVYQTGVLNIIWSIIALAAIVKIVF